MSDTITIINVTFLDSVLKPSIGKQRFRGQNHDENTTTLNINNIWLIIYFLVHERYLLDQYNNLFISLVILISS